MAKRRKKKKRRLKRARRKKKKVRKKRKRTRPKRKLKKRKLRRKKVRRKKKPRRKKTRRTKARKKVRRKKKSRRTKRTKKTRRSNRKRTKKQKRVRKRRPPRKIEAFNFPPGRRISRKYEVVTQLGTGWEAEVYLIRELETGIERAAKIFFPHRNPRNKVIKFYAKKLHKLRDCPVLIQYHTMESFWHYGSLVTALISEYVEGEQLQTYLDRQKGKRLHYYQALHLLHALAKGMEQIHEVREYHGDLHAENVIIRRHGLGFDLKVMDFFHWAAPRPENIRDDVVALIRVFHQVLGGAKSYPKLPKEVKEIICGLKIGLIWKKFPTAGHLRRYLETMDWQPRK